MRKTVKRSLIVRGEETLRRCSPLFATIALSFVAACGDPGKSGTSTSSTEAPGAPAPSSTAAGSSASVTPSASEKTIPEGVDLLKLVLTSGVKSKDPIDKLDHAPPGQRVYAHVTARNRTSEKKRITVSFRINGDERTMVDLNVGQSWSWRTWAYVTLRDSDKGELTVHVFDDHGAALGTESIPIR